MRLPNDMQLSIYKFLESEEIIFIVPLICRLSNQVIANEYHNRLKNEFSEYFQDAETELAEIKNSRAIFSIMIMHRRFTSEIHLQNTPFYRDLIKKTLEPFLSKVPPWAAVVMGNVMRIEEKKKAAEYLTMAIQLPIAKTLMALMYKTRELREMKLLEKMRNSEAWYSPKFRVHNDFILSHFTGWTPYNIHLDIREHLFQLCEPGSTKRFELLENNFGYAELLNNCWEEFENLSMSKFQYIEKWRNQMKEEKNSMLAGHMAVALEKAYLLMRNELDELIQAQAQEMKQRFQECYQKDSFGFYFEEYYRDEKFRETLLNSYNEEKYDGEKIRLSASLFTKMVYSLIEELNTIESSVPIYPVKITQLLSFIWKGVIDGLPEGILAFDDFAKRLNPDDLQVLCRVNLTENPLMEAQKLIFRIFFIAQQSSKWIFSLYSNYGLLNFRNQKNAKKTLTQYTEHKNDYVSSAANMALGLLCAQDGDQKETEVCFSGASKNISASADYLNFAKQKGFRVPISVADNKQFLLISQQQAKSNKSIDATSSTFAC